MKVNNFIKKWREKQNSYEKIASGLVFVSFIVQIIYMIVIPCLVMGLDYNIAYIFAMLFVALFVDAILYFATLVFGMYVSKSLNIITFISLVITTILLTNVGILGNIEYLSIPKRQDYIQLLECAENINTKEQLFEIADGFSWYKESGRYYANLKGEKAGEQLIVTYDKNFEITNTEWRDNYSGTVLLVFILLICIMLATICISYIASLILKSKMINKNSNT